MSRVVLMVVLVVFALWLALSLGWVPASLVPAVGWIVGTFSSLATTFFILSLLYAPGIYRDWYDGIKHFFARFGLRGREIEDLQRKIAHLDKPHHMLQLGLIFARQGRLSRARPWLEQAYQREPDSLESQYRLALCYFDQGDYARALPLLEQVNAQKSDHDYGLAYLRFAQTLERCGQGERARAVYEQMLKFYPGQPEGTYHYALLLAGQGDLAGARRHMAELIRTVRLAPAFQRRRNRHWLLKAKWWLWRNPG